MFERVDALDDQLARFVMSGVQFELGQVAKHPLQLWPVRNDRVDRRLDSVDANG